MLTIRILHMLAVGVCLFLIAKYCDFFFATTRGLEALMKRPFFDVERLTAEIRLRMAHRRGGPPAGRLPLEHLHGSVRRWLRTQLRKMGGANAGGH